MCVYLIYVCALYICGCVCVSMWVSIYLSIYLSKEIASVLVSNCQFMTQERDVIEHSNCGYTLICL